MSPLTRSTSRDKVHAHRARMKRSGMRLVQMWVPDTRHPHQSIQAPGARDSLAIANSRHEHDDQAFIDAVSVWPREADVE